MGMKTAYIELNSTNQIHTLSHKHGKPSFLYKGVVFYPNATVTSLQEILHMDYRYFILDIGVLTKQNVSEFLRCDKQFLVCSPSKWRCFQLKESLESIFIHQKQNCFALILNLTKKESTFKFSFIHCKQHYFPYINNPFLLEPHNFDAISLLLKNL